MSRIRKPQEMGARISGPEPFTQEDVEARMDLICGCAGGFEREHAVRRGREMMSQ